MSQKIERNSFVKGAFILGIAGIIVRVIGAVFRIPLAMIITPEGMGYYASAYPIYNFFVVLSTAGLPTAIGRIVAEQRASNEENNIDLTLKSGLMLMSMVGFFGFVVMFFFTDSLVNAINNPGAFYAIRYISPAVLLVSLMSVFRGYFQGYQNMKPFALSQIVEQLARVTFGYLLAFILVKHSYEQAAAGATFGATAGAFFGLLIILYDFFVFRRKNKQEINFRIKAKRAHNDNQATALSMAIPKHRDRYATIIHRILVIAVPITIGAAVLPIMGLIDLFLVMNRLEAIGMGTVANDLFGLYSGYAATIINLPVSITTAIQISIVPAIAAYYTMKAKKELTHLINNGLRMTLLISLPSAAGLIILSRPIMELIYPRAAESAGITGKIVAILGVTVILLGTFQATTGILQGLRQQNKSALNLLIATGFKAVFTFVLVSIPAINIYGAAIATVLAYTVAMVLNFRVLAKQNIVFSFKNTAQKPLISTIVMTIVVTVIYYGGRLVISPKIATVLAIFSGIVVYVYMIFRLQTFTEEDYELIPGGEKMKKLEAFIRRGAHGPKS